MSIRDEMAKMFVKKKTFSFHPDEKARHEDVYKVAWDAALTHAPEVQALCEALRKIAEYETLPNHGKYNNHVEGWYGVADFAREALAKFRAAIQGGEK